MKRITVFRTALWGAMLVGREGAAVRRRRVISMQAWVGRLSRGSAFPSKCDWLGGVWGRACVAGAWWMGFHRRRLRTSGSAWNARVSGLAFGPCAPAGCGGRFRGGSVRFNYAPHRTTRFQPVTSASCSAVGLH
jgi:hypothetical protein